MKIIIIIIISSLLFSCSSQLEQLKQVGLQPELTPVESPFDKVGAPDPIDWPELEMEEVRVTSNSLWQPGARAFFQSKKARRVGDILKVIVEINDKAELDNATSKSRVNKETSKAPIALGVEKIDILPKIDPFGAITIDSDNNFKGNGTVEREEVIKTEVAAMIMQILPNGNLVIHGDQEVRVNYEIRKVTIDGIVQPSDISASNTISSNQIAEARISYGGKGQLTNAQQPRVAHQIIDILTPF